MRIDTTTLDQSQLRDGPRRKRTKTQTGLSLFGPVLMNEAHMAPGLGFYMSHSAQIADGMAV